jgi:hypothetical protein
LSSLAARSLNERHLSAKEAERASVALYSLVYFRGKRVVSPGYATAVSPNGLQVLAPRFGWRSGCTSRPVAPHPHPVAPHPQVLVPRFGLEEWVYLTPRGGGPSPFRWSADERALVSTDWGRIRAMDKVCRHAAHATQRTPRSEG